MVSLSALPPVDLVDIITPAFGTIQGDYVFQRIQVEG